MMRLKNQFDYKYLVNVLIMYLQVSLYDLNALRLVIGAQNGATLRRRLSVSLY